ncbi:amidase [Pseudaminobacter arsenicus]|uniref:Indoleacetamide hydrolase n=1 Tax=Borborobacter arsenicus TaxID=1851146 RepID=A0A432VBR9_9HYPH|nr:amidase [Pseudaminobacter arsenicus]RUM99543.1 amidase [Pseudaminobacter arsenicus]
MTQNLDFMSATELAARIRNGDVSPVDAVDASLARIDEINPRLNAFCAVYAEEAREQARGAERAVREGRELGLLHGVPIAFKDLTPMQGKVTTLGSRAYSSWVPDEDAVIVQAAKKAGAIIVGKTTTPEFAYSSFTQSPLFGVTRNPWSADRTPGGSSGGAAVAVATGCVSLAEGSDMGGSVRIPAALCGIVGLKPSLGRVPFTILPSVYDTLSHFGPLARDCDDAALFLAALQGPNDTDVMSLTERLDLPAKLDCDPARFRIAVSRNLGFYAVDPDVERNLLQVVAHLESLGAEIIEVELPWTKDILTVWQDYWKVFMAAFFGHAYDAMASELDPAVAKLIEQGRTISAVDYKRLEIPRTTWWHQLASILKDCDFLLCPTMALPAPLATQSDRDFGWTDDRGLHHGLDMTAPFNLFGQCPVLSVPSGLSQGGLPTAVQIVGRRNDDLSVLRLGNLIHEKVGRLVPPELPKVSG